MLFIHVQVDVTRNSKIDEIKLLTSYYQFCKKNIAYFQFAFRASWNVLRLGLEEKVSDYIPNVSDLHSKCQIAYL